MIMLVLRSYEHSAPVGLRVRLLRPQVTAQSVPGFQPLLIRMKLTPGSPRPNVYIGSQLVPWAGFDAALQTEINRRPPDWPVYVQGDPESDWSSVVGVIDRIRGLQVQVILLTGRRPPPGKQADPRK